MKKGRGFFEKGLRFSRIWNYFFKENPIEYVYVS
jgi:hypothetical protein